MTPLAPRLALSACATFVDNLVLLRAAPTIPLTISLLLNDIVARLDRAQFLNIRMAPAKVDLLHMIPLSSRRHVPDDSPR